MLSPAGINTTESFQQWQSHEEKRDELSTTSSMVGEVDLLEEGTDERVIAQVEG